MVKRIAGALVALVLVVAAGWWGIRYYGQQRAERRFDSIIQPILPGGTSHGAIQYTPAGDRLEIDAIVARDEAAGLKSIRIEHATIAGASAPRLESIHLAKVSLEGAAGDHVEIDEVVAGGVDLPALARPSGAGAAGATTPAAAPPVQSLSLVGIKAHSGQFDSTVEKLSFSGLKTPLPAGNAGSGDLWAWLARLELDKAEIAGVDFRALGDDAGHAGVRRLAIEGVAPGKLGGIALEGVALDTKDGGGVKLGSVELAGVAYRPRSTSEKAAAALLGLPGADWLPGRLFFDRFALSDVSVLMPGGGDVTLKDIRSAMAGTIAQATGFEFQVNELSIDLTKLPPSPLGVDPRDLGLPRLVLNVDVKSTYDPATKLLEIPRYAFVLPKLGSLTMSASLGNLVYDDGAEDPVVAMQRILAAELRRFEIRYDDDSLVRRLMELAAKEQNSDVETVRSGLIDRAELQKATLSQKPELGEMLDAVIAFLRDPHAITITLAPPKPLPLATFDTLSGMDPSDVPALLGLTIK
ncbi:MAG TPA: hypothetical protein VN823_14945 [Stellaceae bacterium]|nr:hypothetical protein [Stellaceae bacterium]